MVKAGRLLLMALHKTRQRNQSHLTRAFRRGAMVREQRVTFQKTSLGFKSQPESLQELPLFIASCLQSKEAEEGYCQQKPNFPDTMKALVDGAHFLSKDLLPKAVADFHKAGSQEELCTWGKHRAPSQDHSLGFYD